VSIFHVVLLLYSYVIHPMIVNYNTNYALCTHSHAFAAILLDDRAYAYYYRGCVEMRLFLF
jgi:hypothetical protein